MRKSNLTPRRAKTEAQICRLRRDNIDTSAGFWFLVHEGHVTIAKQRVFEDAEWVIEIPRKDFEKFIDYYNGE